MVKRTTVAAVLALVAGLGFAGPASADTQQHLPRPRVAPAVTTAQENDLITDAPTAIHLGATETPIPVTVGSDLQLESIGIDLYVPNDDNFDDPVASAAAYPGHTVRSIKFRPTLYSEKVNHYGRYEWSVGANDDQGVFHQALVYAEIKANSLLRSTATRSGPTVTFTVSAQVWNNAARRYTAYPTGVYLQKQAANGHWTNIGGTTLGSSGRSVTTVNTGAGVYRLYDHVTTTIWSTTTTVHVD